MQLAVLAALMTVIIAAVGALASYADNYYTESVGQWVANDLRVRVYDHLEHLPLAQDERWLLSAGIFKVFDHPGHRPVLQRHQCYRLVPSCVASSTGARSARVAHIRRGPHHVGQRPPPAQPFGGG